MESCKKIGFQGWRTERFIQMHSDTMHNQKPRGNETDQKQHLDDLCAQAEVGHEESDEQWGDYYFLLTAY